MVGVGKVGLVSNLEIGNVIAAKFHQPSTLQRVERLNDARAAKIDRSEAALTVILSITVLRMRRPAIFEKPLGVLNDFCDGRPDTIWIPLVLDQPFVGLRGKEHRPRLEAPGDPCHGAAHA